MIDNILSRGRIKRLFSVLGSGTTGEAHIAILNNKKYLLRICKDKETALRYTRLYKKLKRFGFFPKLIESEGKYLLFEYLIGRDLKEKEDKKNIFQVGKICGQINKTKSYGKYEDKFLLKLEEVNKLKIFPLGVVEKVRERYNGLKRKIGPKIGLDAGDVTHDNFRLSNGKVYFVDIEAIKYQIKGIGITKAFISWFKQKEERESFRKGYNSVYSMNFFSKDYFELCSFIFLIQRIRYQFKKGNQTLVKIAIKRINKLLDGGEL